MSQSMFEGWRLHLLHHTVSLIWIHLSVCLFCQVLPALSLGDTTLSLGKKLAETEHQQMVEFEADFFSMVRAKARAKAKVEKKRIRRKGAPSKVKAYRSSAYLYLRLFDKTLKT